MHPFQDCPRVRNVPVGQVPVHRQRIHLPRHLPFRQGQKRLQLAREEEPLPVVPINQRLLPQPVPSQHQPPLGRVPDRQGEHPPQKRHEPRPLILIKMNKNLRVPLRSQDVPARLQPAPQRGEVVDLAVEHSPYRAVLVRERLMPPREVHNREPPKPKRRMPVAIAPRVVRPPMRDPARHRREGLVGQRPPPLIPGRAHNPAHALARPRKTGRAAPLPRTSSLAGDRARDQPLTSDPPPPHPPAASREPPLAPARPPAPPPKAPPPDSPTHTPRLSPSPPVPRATTSPA